MIFVTSSYSYWGNFVPTDTSAQIGGGETAMINVSKELAKLGYDVTVFYDTARPGKYEGVNYLPTALAVPLITQMEHDILISWDNPHIFRFADRSKLRVAAFQLNDAFIGVFDDLIDLYFHPSQWHVDMFTANYPEMTPTKCRARVTNGIDFERYEEAGKDRLSRNRRVIYSSSPDRGLHHLLRIWPRIRNAVPDAELHVYYDYQRWLDLDASLVRQGHRTVTSDRASFLRSYIANGLAPGVIFHGGVGKIALAKAQLSSTLLAYPCDPVRPTEGFSMTVLEALTAGCRAVISNADALPELWASAPGVTILPLPIEEDAWVTTIVSQLSDPEEPGLLRANPHYSWARVARRWDQEFRTCLKA